MNTSLPPSATHDIQPVLDVDVWLLSGGEGRRVGGLDKGLMLWNGSPVALQTLQALSPQVAADAVRIIANRHLDDYRLWGWPVLTDDPTLPTHSGPIIGMLTALRQPGRPWVQFAPCDSPRLPDDLVARLRKEADESGAPLVVPMTIDPADGELRCHWCTTLVRRDLLESLEQAVALGERRIRVWAQQQRWIGVCFCTPASFDNFNTPESLHESPSP